MASTHNHFAYARLPAIRFEGWRPSCNQHCLTYHCGALALLGAAANDRRSVEECHCRSVIRGSPTPFRIGGMGKRTKRRPKRGLLFTHAGCIPSLYTSTICNALSGGCCAVRSRAHVQTNAGKRTRYTSPSGLLASTSL